MGDNVYITLLHENQTRVFIWGKLLFPRKRPPHLRREEGGGLQLAAQGALLRPGHRAQGWDGVEGTGAAPQAAKPGLWSQTAWLHISALTFAHELCDPAGADEPLGPRLPHLQNEIIIAPPRANSVYLARFIEAQEKCLQETLGEAQEEDTGWPSWNWLVQAPEGFAQEGLPVWGRTQSS